MSLYNKPEGGSFLPFVKYNAKAGRWYVKKDGEEVEVQNPTFVADFKNVKKIWALFVEGQAPDIAVFDDFETDIPRPTDKHKLGIKMNMFSNDAFGGVVEFTSTAANACGPISDLHEQYLKDAKEGELPVIEVTGANPISGKHGTNYEPVFKVVKYIPRPAEFDEATAEQESTPAAATIAATADAPQTQGKSEF